MTSFPYRRVLLVCGSHVGNNLFCTPAIAFLKRHLPQVRFDVVATSRRGASVFENNPDLDAVFRVARRRSVRRLAERYELAIGLHWDQARECLEGARVERRTIDVPPAGVHRADAILAFAARLIGVPVQESDRAYVLVPRARDFARVDAALGRADPRSTLLGLHLGSGRTAIHGWKFWYWKRARDVRIWPLRKYAELGGRLRAAVPGSRLVLTGSRNERFLARAFARALPGVIDLVGDTSLLELAALMTRLHGFVTHDNGVLHVACASGIPVVGLFGPSRPAETGMFPSVPWQVAIKRDTMAEIEPDEVCAALVAELAEARLRRASATAAGARR